MKFEGIDKNNAHARAIELLTEDFFLECFR